MKAKKSLLPKSKLWISLTLIFLPLVILLGLVQFNCIKESDELLKISRIAFSVTFIGMLVLFMTKWTKDDGDEMYMQMRITASVFAIVNAIIVLFVMSIFEFTGWFEEEF